MEGFQSFESTLMEHQFWIQIMGDHARFMFFSLSPNEVEHLQRSQDFIISFDNTLEQINQSTNKEELELITNISFSCFQKVELQILEYTLIHH